jgi:hypothetical protein
MTKCRKTVILLSRLNVNIRKDVYEFSLTLQLIGCVVKLFLFYYSVCIEYDVLTQHINPSFLILNFIIYFTNYFPLFCRKFLFFHTKDLDHYLNIKLDIFIAHLNQVFKWNVFNATSIFKSNHLDDWKMLININPQ